MMNCSSLLRLPEFDVSLDTPKVNASNSTSAGGETLGPSEIGFLEKLNHEITNKSFMNGFTNPKRHLQQASRGTRVWRSPTRDGTSAVSMHISYSILSHPQTGATQSSTNCFKLIIEADIR